MTSSEKRYFKLNIDKYQKNEGKHYLKLFEALDAQNVYSAKEIKRKMMALPGKQLTVVKIYLYKQIIKSLRNFNDESSISIKMGSYLAEVEILFNKELYSECIVAIKKAKAFALKYEQFTSLLQLHSWEITVAKYVMGPSEAAASNQKTIEEEREVIVKYEEIIEMQQVHLKSLYLLRSIGLARNAEEMEDYKTILNHPVMQHETKSASARRSQLVMQTHLAQYKGDINEIYEASKNVIRHFELHPFMAEQFVSVYYGNLAQFAGMCMYLRKFKEAERVIAKVELIGEKYKSGINIKHQLRLAIIKMELLLIQGEIEKMISRIIEIRKQYEKRYDAIEPTNELYLNYYFSMGYWMRKDWKNAQAYLLKIIHYPNQEIRLDVQRTARIANLILQYEQGEYTHLGYIIRSTYRYLLKKKSLHKIEDIIIRFFKKAVSYTSHRQVFNGLAELKQQILPLMDEPFERNFLLDFPLIEWIDSKLKKKDLAEIRRENYNLAVAKEEALN